MLWLALRTEGSEVLRTSFASTPALTSRFDRLRSSRSRMSRCAVEVRFSHPRQDTRPVTEPRPGSDNHPPASGLRPARRSHGRAGGDSTRRRMALGAAAEVTPSVPRPPAIVGTLTAGQVVVPLEPFERVLCSRDHQQSRRAAQYSPSLGRAAGPRRAVATSRRPQAQCSAALPAMPVTRPSTYRTGECWPCRTPHRTRGRQ